MDITKRKKLTFTVSATGQVFSTLEPTVSHIEAMLEIGEGEENEPTSKTVRRAIAQMTALCTGARPPLWRLGELGAWWHERVRVRAFIRGLTYGQLSQVITAVLAAAHGVDVEEFTEGQKKNEELETEAPQQA